MQLFSKCKIKNWAKDNFDLSSEPKKICRGNLKEDSSLNIDKNSEKTREYISEVCEQIKWKKAHDFVSKELLNHIYDQKLAFLQKLQEKNAEKNNQGKSIKEDIQKQAEKLAVEQMGDPVIVGESLNRIHKPKTEWSILIVVFICILIGIAFQYFITYKSGIDGQGAYYENQASFLLSILVGICAFLAVYFADYTIIARKPKIIFITLLGICWLIAFLMYGNVFLFGSFRHMIYFSLLMIPVYGVIIYSERGSGYIGILKCGIIASLAVMLFIWGNSFVSAFIFSLVGIIMLTVSLFKDWFKVKKIKALALIYIPILGIVAYFCWQQKYFLARVSAIFLYQSDGYSYVYKIVNDYLSASKPFGQGDVIMGMNGQEIIIENMLPMWHSDYTLTYFIYKIGYVPVLIVVSFLVFFLIKMCIAVFKQTSKLGFIISLSVLLCFAIQICTYVCNNFGLTMGLYGNLPFITRGKTFFTVNMILLGLFLSAYRNMTIVEDIAVTYKNKRIKNIYLNSENNSL